MKKNLLIITLAFLLGARSWSLSILQNGAIPEPVAINTSGVAGVIVVGTVNCPSGAKNSTSLPNGSVLKKCEPTPLGMTSTKSSKPCALLGSLQSEYERRVPLG
jgi:hypothetical protein